MRRPLVTTVLLAVAALAAGCVTPPPGEPGPAPDLRVLDGLAQVYPDPGNAALTWARAHPGAPDAGLIERTIGVRPSARWFTAAETDLTTRVRAYVTAAADARMMPLLVASFAGAEEACPRPGAAGLVDAFARGIGDRKAIVVLEPGLLGSRCGTDPAVTGYLAAAVDSLRGLAPDARTLLDATSAAVPPDALAQRLAAAGLARADGFSLNVGGYAPGAELAAGRAQQIRSAVQSLTGRGDYTAFADSARNGAPVTSACNPAGAKLGPSASFTNQPAGLQQAWITLPGTSDGPCGTAPGSAKGEFVPALAAALAGG
ncbi:glycoside hydrolase family 6 protein [Amycolatopsis sp. MtRt-6]|uniref:glycoside hydrolase family 6 protein n=1 Tax=Amycolatopsis sp. MtRt-6 TaxID=2792782 RepID=UPI001A8FB878|nr:glycoside hydrolase family 6 protein [Amycolatopsis sp. MtRt-6]